MILLEKTQSLSKEQWRESGCVLGVLGFGPEMQNRDLVSYHFIALCGLSSELSVWVNTPPPHPQKEGIPQLSSAAPGGRRKMASERVGSGIAAAIPKFISHRKN